MRFASWGLALLLAGCGNLAWNTTVSDHPQVRSAMLSSIQPGLTTETGFRTRWGNPTQKIRDGGQVAYVYRNMTNPRSYLFPQFGESNDFVVVEFQYGVATRAYSSDMQGCRATFAPRPPGAAYPNPSTVKPVNCGVPVGADAGRDKGLLEMIHDFAVDATGSESETGQALPAASQPGVPDDRYFSGHVGKYH